VAVVFVSIVRSIQFMKAIILFLGWEVLGVQATIIHLGEQLDCQACEKPLVR
jgi:hypothetical protein